MWLHIDTLPSAEYTLLSTRAFSLIVNKDGDLLLSLSSAQPKKQIDFGKLPLKRWVHVAVTLEHLPGRRRKDRMDAIKCGLYLDGLMSSSSVVHATFVPSASRGEWIFGDKKIQMDWNMASACFVSHILREVSHRRQCLYCQLTLFCS